VKTTVGIKGWNDPAGWHWTYDVTIEHDGHPQQLEPSEMQQIEIAIEEQRAIIIKRQDEWLKPKTPVAQDQKKPEENKTPPAAPKAEDPKTAAPEETKKTPICSKCGGLCDEKKGRSGMTYFFCYTCKENRRRDGTPYPDERPVGGAH